jgi:hypothetical protein
VTLEALSPDETARRDAAEAAERRAALDKQELAELERPRMVGRTLRKRSILDRLLRRH